jgi:ankyrin repeat protein
MFTWYIIDSRAYLDAAYRSVLRTYVLSPSEAPPPAGLVGLLEAPRVKLVNLAYVDDASGTTLLHEAARRKDLRLVELAVRSGADVFVRDRKGKSVVDVVGKDDRVKAFLRQCRIFLLSHSDHVS